MKKPLNLPLYALSGIIFIFASVIGKNPVFIPIGAALIAIGSSRKGKSNKNKSCMEETK